MGPREDDCCRKCGHPNGGHDHAVCPTECQECGTLYYENEDYTGECPNCRAHEIIDESSAEVVEYLKDILIHAGESATRPAIRRTSDPEVEAYTARFHKSFDLELQGTDGEMFLVLTRKMPHKFVTPTEGYKTACAVCGFGVGHSIHKIRS